LQGEPVAVDSFTHGLTATILAYALGLPGLIPFAVAGAVILDADTFFARAFDGRPSLYLFTHGGITHSLAGAAVMALPAWAVAALVAPAVPFFPEVAAPLAFAAVLAGAYLHLGLDTLACPGLPLLAPASDRKYTVGLLPGPSILLFGVSIVALVLLALGAISWPETILPYVAIILAFLAVRLAAFSLVRVQLHGTGRVVPRISPLRWLVIGETPYAWKVSEYRMGNGTTEPTIYPKYRGTTAEAVAPYLAIPEARRVRYHSYITTAEREGAELVIADPLRESGAFFYPPHFKRARIPLRDGTGR
jgi:inner membrane protein